MYMYMKKKKRTTLYFNFPPGIGTVQYKKLLALKSDWSNARSLPIKIWLILTTDPIK